MPKSKKPETAEGQAPKLAVSKPPVAKEPAAKKPAAKKPAAKKTAAKTPSVAKPRKAAAAKLTLVEPKNSVKEKSNDKPVAAEAPAVRVFQIYFDAAQKKKLNKYFVPLNNIGNTDPLLEMGVIRKLYNSEHTAGLKYWGAVSWKFEEKMALSGETLLTHIAQNPDYDVYFCNPFVEVEALYQNLWVQGAVAHPNFLKICDATLRGVGMNPKVLSRPMPSGLFATANFFVANKKFWDAYMAYIENFIAKVETLPKKMREGLYTANADPGGIHNGVSYMPFIIERLFSEFLVENLGKFKALKVKSPALEKRQTVYYNNLRMLKDAAIVSKSDWMLDCWSNYRKVLMGSINGKEWMEKHLPLVNFLSNDYIVLKP